LWSDIYIHRCLLDLGLAFWVHSWWRSFYVGGYRLKVLRHFLGFYILWYLLNLNLSNIWYFIFILGLTLTLRFNHISRLWLYFLDGLYFHIGLGLIGYHFWLRISEIRRDILINLALCGWPFFYLKIHRHDFFVSWKHIKVGLLIWIFH
jgi:predicted outer membrane lipoprotein